MFVTHLGTATWIGYIALFIGTAVSLSLSIRRYGWKGVPLVGLTLLVGIYGARVWGTLVYGRASPGSDIWWRAATWDYHLYYHHASIVGGILGGVLGVVVFSSVSRLPTLATLGILTPGVAAAQGVGRIQCQLIGCCFGTPTNLPWGVSYPANTYAGFWSGPLPLHPAQLYESVLDLALSVLLMRLVARSNERHAGAAYLAGYGAIRFFIEFVRVGRDGYVLYLSSAQWFSLGSVFVGVALGMRLSPQHASDVPSTC